MHVPALQRVIVALFLGAVVQNAGVLEARVIAEQRLDEQLFGPADAIAHRADDRVLPDHDAHVAREEQVGERGGGVAGLVERGRGRPPGAWGDGLASCLASASDGTTSRARVPRNSRTSARATSSVRSVRTS